MKPYCPNCKQVIRRKREAAKPVDVLVISDEYREFVTGILKDKRRRDVIESYRNLPEFNED